MYKSVRTLEKMRFYIYKKMICYMMILKDIVKKNDAMKQEKRIPIHIAETIILKNSTRPKFRWIQKLCRNVKVKKKKKEKRKISKSVMLVQASMFNVIYSSRQMMKLIARNKALGLIITDGNEFRAYCIKSDQNVYNKQPLRM